MCTTQIAKMMVNPIASMTGFGNQKTQPVVKQKQTKVNNNKKQIKGTE
jgi:hypothetical protein